MLLPFGVPLVDICLNMFQVIFSIKPREYSSLKEIYSKFHSMRAHIVGSGSVSLFLILYYGQCVFVLNRINYRCCLRLSHLMPYWFISRNTVTFHKYFRCSQFCEFHSKRTPYIFIFIYLLLNEAGKMGTRS